MGVAVSTIAFPVTSVQESGPRNRFAHYVIQVPAGNVAVSKHVWCGPIDFDNGQLSLHVSANNASGADNIKFSVYGALSTPTVTPTARTWVIMRGDRASGAAGKNDTLSAVTCGGHVAIVTPARSYIIRVCSVTAVSAAVNITLLAVGAG